MPLNVNYVYFIFLASISSISHSQQISEQQLRIILAKNNISYTKHPGPDTKSPLFTLGKALFFTKSLSLENDVACASCHHPLLAGGDQLALPIGVMPKNPDTLGPERKIRPDLPDDNGYLDINDHHNVPRNSPTTFNIGLYTSRMFWDGRVEKLDDGSVTTPESGYGFTDPNTGTDIVAAQALFPVGSKDEMRNYINQPHDRQYKIHETLVARLLGKNARFTRSQHKFWRDIFEKAFNKSWQAITYTDISNALSHYQKSQIFTKSPWSNYLAGNNDSLTEKQKQGAVLFFSGIENNGAGCYQCHSSEHFSDEQFHVLAIPQIGKGKNVGRYGDDDFGRYLVTGKQQDKYAFRTPALLNVELTQPYGHDGAYEKLTDIIKHHNSPETILNESLIKKLPANIPNKNVMTNTGYALQQLKQKPQTLMKLKVKLDDKQLDALVAFLKSLTDPCINSASCLQPWLPDEQWIKRKELRMLGYP